MKLEFYNSRLSICEVEKYVVNRDGSPLDEPFFFIEAASSGPSDYLIVETVEHFFRGTYELKYVIQSVQFPAQVKELPFKIDIVGGNNCVKKWRYPPAPFTFDTLYASGTEAVAIEFYEVDISNCAYTMTVMNVTDPTGPQQIDPRIATLQQPILLPNTRDEMLIAVSDYGRLIVQTGEAWAEGRHRLRLVVSTDPMDSSEKVESRSLDFNLFIVPCISVLDDTETVHESFTYFIGGPVLELPIVEPLVQNCTNSDFTILNSDELPAAFAVERDIELR